MKEQDIANGIQTLSSSFNSYEAITYTQSGWKGLAVYPNMEQLFQFKIGDSTVKYNPIQFAEYLMNEAKQIGVTPTLSSNLNGEDITLRINKILPDHILFTMTVRHKVGKMSFAGNIAALNNQVSTFNTHNGEIENRPAAAISIKDFVFEESVVQA